MNRNLFIFIGGSASGKTTLEERLIEEGMERLVSDTTREKRESEENGVHYNFLDIDEFRSKEYANIIHITDTWKYGVSEDELRRLSQLKTDSIYSVINIEPAINIKRFIQEKGIPLNVYLVFFDIDTELRVELMKKRGESESDIRLRLQREDQIDLFKEFGEKPDLIVTDLYQSYNQVSSFIKKVEICNSLEQVFNHDFNFTSRKAVVEEVIEVLQSRGLWK